MHHTNSMNCRKVNYLHALPDDLLDLIISFADIPSIGAICQTCRPNHGTLSYIASREKVWLGIANLRFNLFSTKSHDKLHHKYLSNSRLYGGPTWKDAYRAMAVTCRMPKMGANFSSKKKYIFAKSRESTNIIEDGENDPSTTKPATNQLAHSVHCLAAWLMIHHTEDCRLRYFSNNSRQDLRSWSNDDDFLQQDINTGFVYIQLQLAIQNTKSACCTIHVNVGSAAIRMYTPMGSIMSRGIVQGGVLGPKVIHRRSHQLDRSETTSTTRNTTLDEKCQKIVSLKPFEFAVVRINVPLPQGMQHTDRLLFETDFLSRAMSISIPATCEITNPHNGTDLHSKGHMTHVYSTIMTANFISENEIWERYMELPGNCLVLIDRRDG
jgi:hypothetical protein